MKVLLVAANREQLPGPVPPIGVLSIAAAVRDRCELRVLDLCFEADPHAALDAALAERPEVVAFGFRNLSDNAYRGREALLAEYAALVRRAKAGGAVVVAGGSAWSLQQRALGDELGVDYGVAGEGEQAFGQLLDALATGRPERRIWSAPAGDFGKVAWDLCDPRYLAHDGTRSIQTRRGCAFTCAYCDYPDLEGKKVRTRPIEAVVADVLAAAADGVQHIFFVDSVFNVPRRYTQELCAAIAEVGAPIPWTAYISPVGLDEATVGGMARAGCVAVELGTDSGTEAGLRRLHKPFSLEQVRRSRRLLADAGIHDCHTFVLGACGEDRDGASGTLDFVHELDPDVAVFMVFVEDRETHGPHVSPARDEILECLRDAAWAHPRWVVPEIGLRFGRVASRVAARVGHKGPSWILLARSRA